MVNWLKTHKANILICLLLLPITIENSIDLGREENLSNLYIFVFIIIEVLINYVVVEGVKYLIKKGDKNESSNSN